MHGDIHSFLYTGSPAMHSHVLALVVQVRGPGRRRARCRRARPRLVRRRAGCWACGVARPLLWLQGAASLFPADCGWQAGSPCSLIPAPLEFNPCATCPHLPPPAWQGGKGYGAASGVGKLQNLRVAVQRRWNNTVSDTSRQQVRSSCCALLRGSCCPLLVQAALRRAARPALPARMESPLLAPRLLLRLASLPRPAPSLQL